MTNAVQILDTISSENPKASATAFSSMLALSKGVGSSVSRSRGGYLVTADDGRGILFVRAAVLALAA